MTLAELFEQTEQLWAENSKLHDAENGLWRETERSRDRPADDQLPAGRPCRSSRGAMFEDGSDDFFVGFDCDA
jgi:hypothetical protein